MSASAPVIKIEDVSKRFGATRALDGVSLEVGAGSIHALIGLNGSGKSTLVKVLSGFHHADEGHVKMEQVAFVHQDFGLLPALSVLENFAVGRPMAMRLGQIDWRAEAGRARAALKQFGLDDRLHVPVAELSMAQQAILAIARALDRSTEGDTKALVLDEPTSALPSHEIEILATAMRGYAASGLGIVFITHRLQEVVDLADTVTILRNGTVVYSGPTAELSISDMVGHMVGDAPQHADTDWTPNLADGAPVLRCRDLHGGTLAGVDLDVRGGEILGVFGMVGSGIEHLGAVVSGRAAPTSGQVTFGGEPLQAFGKRMTEVAYIPSDRVRRGIFPGLSVRENVSLRRLHTVVKHGRISARAERSLARHWVQALKIKPQDPEAPISTLSGGNQQKAVLGRWLAIEPRVIVAEEPTQGIDVWAKADILRELRRAAQGGTGVLLTAVEPEEILDFCDRVVVLRQGRVVADMPRSAASITDIVSAMH
jgi:ABC-type sugar transport system ATPase subunit